MQVQELEHRLILEARSCNKRLEDEREAAAKRLSEEQGRLTKEKQNLQRMLREERRKAPDPITQQELMNLKQEVKMSVAFIIFSDSMWLLSMLS